MNTDYSIITLTSHFFIMYVYGSTNSGGCHTILQDSEGEHICSVAWTGSIGEVVLRLIHNGETVSVKKVELTN